MLAPAKKKKFTFRLFNHLEFVPQQHLQLFDFVNCLFKDNNFLIYAAIATETK